MSQDPMTFVVEALRQMNFDVENAGPGTVLGPAGIDLDSLAVAELLLRIEDTYGVTFDEDDTEGLATLTLGHLAEDISRRRRTAVNAGGGGH